MSFAQCNGSRIAYQQLGEGADLILIHGLATNRAFWYANLAQQLKEHYRVTLYDLRGHGYSERTRAGYAAQDMALDLAELMDELGIARADLVGHSYGGGVALELAVMNPRRVRRLALLDTKVNRLQPHQRLDDMPLSAFEREVIKADGRDWSLDDHIGLRYLRIMAELRIKGLETRTRDHFTPFGEGRGGLRSARQYLALLEETNAEREFTMTGAGKDELATLAVPLLMVYGEHSRCQPSGQAMLAIHPDARLVRVPDAGHFFPASHPQRVMRELQAFLGFPGEARRFAPAELLRNAL